MKTFRMLSYNCLIGVALNAIFMFSNTTTYAQSGIILSWDSEVGCLDYSYDKDREAPIETIGDEDCLLVCETSDVSFTIDYGTQTYVVVFFGNGIRLGQEIIIKE